MTLTYKWSTANVGHSVCQSIEVEADLAGVKSNRLNSAFQQPGKQDTRPRVMRAPHHTGLRGHCQTFILTWNKRGSLPRILSRGFVFSKKHQATTQKANCRRVKSGGKRNPF